MKFLNAGCGTHYAKGWVNTDVWENEETRPDVLVTPKQPYPFEDNSFDAVFLGHVLEHIDWPSVPEFLRDISRIAKPDAPILVVGPDVYRTVQLWRDGRQPWWLVEAVMEHQDVKPDGTTVWWDGAHHHWNCHEQRVFSLLETLNFRMVEKLSEQIPSGGSWTDKYDRSIEWPIVGKADWQFAVRCVNRI